MRAQYEVRNDSQQRTIRIRMEGKFDARTMQAFADEYKKATDTYNGGQHLVLADMRGMLPSQPEVAHILGRAIGYARQRGVVRCAHLSDDTVQRLQALRLARQTSPDDTATVDVASLSEAEAVLDEARQQKLT